ncbi:unnamed protein product [Rangifer tarandus platyrhynchus]|uniref:Uncharacterized protein n=1 Tax=Rangifer tarandus platyrhynchus TaxID=3082113 RepID=A0AC59YB31_RANTA
MTVGPERLAPASWTPAARQPGPSSVEHGAPAQIGYFRWCGSAPSLHAQDIITSVLRACPHLHHPASPSTCHLHGARRPRRGNVTVMFKYSPTTVTSQPLGEPASSAVQERLEGTGQKP